MTQLLPAAMPSIRENRRAMLLVPGAGNEELQDDAFGPLEQPHRDAVDHIQTGGRHLLLHLGDPGQAARHLRALAWRDALRLETIVRALARLLNR
jgi:hypothetical protein